MLAILNRPVSAASLGVFRIFFGLMMTVSGIRFWAKGWIHDFYIAPPFLFTYPGFSWVQPWPEWGLYLHMGIVILSAILITVGAYYRPAIITFFLGFTYIELLDKTPYLNHYYAVSLIAFLMIFCPCHRAYSWDQYRYQWPKISPVPFLFILILRCQLGIIYVGAGLAKLNHDWLFLSQPLKLWLRGRSELPLIGPLFDIPITATLFSYTGLIYDLCIPFLLSISRTRPYAYCSVILFHLMTSLLFNIGLFPYMMIGLSLIFFPPDWPERQPSSLLNQRCLVPAKCTYYGLALFFCLQLLLPLRHHLYPGPVLWNEDGYRFSWHVMAMEKVGQVSFRIQALDSQREWRVHPQEYLSDFQVKQMATQADMCHQFAQYLAQQIPFPVAIYADSVVSLNGRESVPYLNPKRNLLRPYQRNADLLLPYPW